MPKFDASKTPFVPVILCGGVGRRLWPVSQDACPKQFHTFGGERSLLQRTIERAAGYAGAQTPMLFVGADTAPLAREQAAALGRRVDMMIEPVGRNTAPAAAIAALLAQKQDGPEALVLLVPSDHHIAPVTKFRETIAAAAPLAANGKIVVFGIPPTRPETGYGYIRQVAPLGEGFEVAAFEEKPDEKTAKAYLESGDRLWNAGLFLFRADILLQELARFEPEILSAVKESLGADGRINAAAFSRSPSVPLDIAVMERTAHAAVIPTRFHWSDVGTWPSLADALETDEDGNILTGDIEAIDCKNSYLRGEGVTLTALGVDDLIVVATGDAVFVAPRSRAHDVKKILAELKVKGPPSLL